MKMTGTFVWHELMTTNPEAALAYYGELFGWTFKSGDFGPMKYHEIMVDGRPIGGITGLMGPQRPPAWAAYVGVDDIDAAVARGTRCGGTVQAGPMDIPGTGRFAMMADPSGAVIAPFTYANADLDKPTLEGVPGTFAWNEVMTDDVDAAKAFYGEVFGWSTRAQDMGPMGTYHLFQREGKDVAGMMKRPDGVPGCFWMHYVGVRDIDATNALALKLGSRQIVPPMDIPGVGRFSSFIDPQGAVISLFKGSATAA